MKRHLYSARCVATVATAIGALCYANFAFAAESTTYAPEPVDFTGSKAALTGPDPTRIGSMAGVGAKPSKADLAKMEAEKSAHPTALAAARLSAQDRSFLMEATKTSLTEAQAGQLAATHGQSAEVKKLGAQIAGDRLQAGRQLAGLAQRKGVKVDTTQKKLMMSAGGFDQEWLTRTEKGHQKVIALLEKEAKTGQDAEVKTWAARTLPALRKDLRMVQGAQKKMARTN